MKLLKPATIACLLAFWASAVTAQDIQNPDLLFKQAREAAFQNEDYPEAIRLARKALEITPDYTEIRVFLGRVYFWSGKTGQARDTFLEILENDAKQKDARIELINVELENDRPYQALDLAEKGLDFHPSDTDLRFRKGRALMELGREEDALREFRQVRRIDPGYPHVRSLIQRLQGKLLHWQAMISYSHEQFSNPFDPWHLGTFELLRETRVGDFIGRLNYDRRFGQTDTQVELDAYPTLSRSMYAYANVGYSPGTFFPQFRAGLSLFHQLPKAFEAELGFRYLYFSDPNLMIYTASISKYYRQYWFTVRPFFSPDLEEGNNFSTQLIARRFFSDSDNYLSLIAGFGSSPYGYNSQQDISRLSSTRFELEAQKKFSSRFLVRGHVGFMREEYRTDGFRNRLIGGLKLYFRF